MSLSEFDSMWNVMSKYTCLFSNESGHDDLKCVICKKIMTNGVSSSVCGCHYCYQCISEYANEEEKYCPGGREFCQDETIKLGVNSVKNSILNKRISRLSTKCPNEFCESYVQLIEMEDHLLQCIKQPMECPYVAIGCISEKSNKDEIVSHLHSDTMTHSGLIIELFINLKNEHCVLKDEFAKSKIEIDSLKEQLIDKEERIVKIEKQNESNERQKNEEIENLKDGMEKIKREISSLNEELSKKEDEKMDRESEAVTVVNDLKENIKKNDLEMMLLKEELLEKENKIVALHKELGEVKNEVEIRVTGEREGIIKELNEQRRHIEDANITREKIATQLNDVRKDIDEIRADYVKMRADYDKMMDGKNINYGVKRINKHNKLYPNIHADFVCRFEDLSQNYCDDLWSESFYSNDYKLCLKMNISDFEDYIGLHCYIMKGDNDERVEWPLRRAVTLSIIDQNNLLAFKNTTFQSSFNRPTDDEGDCVGDDHFIKYSFIKKQESIIVNDSIVVSLIISDD